MREKYEQIMPYIYWQCFVSNFWHLKPLLHTSTSVAGRIAGRTNNRSADNRKHVAWQQNESLRQMQQETLKLLAHLSVVIKRVNGCLNGRFLSFAMHIPLYICVYGIYQTCHTLIHLCAQLQFHVRWSSDILIHKKGDKMLRKY